MCLFVCLCFLSAILLSRFDHEMFSYFSETAFDFVVQIGLEFMRSFLRQPPECWDYWMSHCAQLPGIISVSLPKILYHGARLLSASVDKPTEWARFPQMCCRYERGTRDCLHGKSLTPPEAEAVLKTNGRGDERCLSQWQCELTACCHVCLLILGLASVASRGQEPGQKPGSGPEKRGGFAWTLYTIEGKERPFQLLSG